MIRPKKAEPSNQKYQTIELEYKREERERVISYLLHFILLPIIASTSNVVLIKLLSAKSIWLFQPWNPSSLTFLSERFEICLCYFNFFVNCSNGGAQASKFIPTVT